MKNGIRGVIIRMREDKKGEEFWGKKESRMRRENITHGNINLSI